MIEASRYARADDFLCWKGYLAATDSGEMREQPAIQPGLE